MSMHVNPRNSGWIEVICGPMFSGKTEELIRRITRALYAKQSVQVFKPSIDVRYDPLRVTSHSHQKLASIAVERAADIAQSLRPDTQVVGIDEVQFLGADVVPLVESMADRGLRVICAGLDLDYRGLPFEPTPSLMARAEDVTKLLAICVVCGNPAGRTQRTAAGAERVVVGAADAYEARCRHCHVPEAAEPTPPQSLPLF